jgi:DNA-binding winged helix-turn-helix (wHTH) protein/TolB-like protein
LIWLGETRLSRWRWSNLIYFFDSYALDTDRRELRCGANLVGLQPQVFDLLEYLIRSRDRVVTKDDMLDAIWGRRIVSESTLTSRINAARTAIGDNGQAQRLIRTVPRKGIRFVATVREEGYPVSGAASVTQAPTWPAFAIEQPAPVAGLDQGVVAAERAAGEAAIKDDSGRTSRLSLSSPNFRTFSIALALFAALISLPLLAQGHFLWKAKADTTFLNIVPVGVLPFEPFNANGEMRAAAELLSDELVNTLSRVPNFQVISRLASRQNGGRSKDVASIGSELGVRYLLDGTVRIEGDRLHLDAELTDTKSGLQVWSHQFEGSPTESSVSRQEMVRGLCRVLQVEMMDLNNGRVATKRPQLLKTEELLASGWSALNGTAAANTYPQAEASFHEVLQRDPEQLSAMLGLAAHHVIAVGNLVVPDKEPYLGQAEDLLNRILIRQPGSSSAYYYRGLMQKLRGELEPALTSFERSIALNPSFAPAYGQTGQVLTSLGRPEEGLEQILYAMRLNPQDPTMPSWDIFAGQAELELGHDAEGLKWLIRAVGLSPNSRMGNGGLAAAYVLVGDQTNAELYAMKFKSLTKGVSDERRLELFGAFLPPPSSHRIAEGLRLALGNSDGTGTSHVDSANLR